MQKTEKPSLAAVLIVKNEAAELAACLDTVAGWVDEIIVFDSGSTDNTREIALRYGAKFYTQPDWQGFGRQRRLAQQCADSDYVFWLDADERVSQALKLSVQRVLSQNKSNVVYRVNRLNHIFGRAIRHSGWYPDRVVRLYSKALTQYSEAAVHESVEIPDGCEVCDLDGDLIHYTYRDLNQYLRKSAHYADLWSQERLARQQKGSLWGAVLHALGNFFKMYVLKAGFLDGRYGFLLAVLSAQSVFAKYAALWLKQQANRRAHMVLLNLAKGFGGGERQAEQLLRALLEQSGGRTELAFFGRRQGELARRLAEGLPDVRRLSGWQLLRLLWGREKVVIHAYDGRSVHLGAVLKLLSGCPLLVTRHVSFPLKRRLSRWSYRLADRLVCVSRQIENTMRVHHPACQTVYGCVGRLEENLGFEKTWFGPPSQRLKIGHIGNFQAVKNFPLTIDLAKLLPEADFYLIGSGELEEDLKKQAAGLPNVFFVPFTPYIGSVLKHLDVQIVPSHSEGLPMVILEGFQYGVPVIAHAVGGIPEIVADGETGWLLADNQAEGYLKILQHIVRHPEQLAVCRDKILKNWAASPFSSERMAAEYEDIYRQLWDQT